MERFLLVKKLFANTPKGTARKKCGKISAEISVHRSFLRTLKKKKKSFGYVATGYD